MSSIQASSSPGQVTIENPVPYAAIHNDGGDITTHPTVTERMRRYAWHMVYSLAGIKGKGKLPKELPAEAEKWKGLALTRKRSIIVHAHIPQRQFMGDSGCKKGDFIVKGCSINYVFKKLVSILFCLFLKSFCRL